MNRSILTSISRRASLLTLGAGLTSVAARPDAAGAKKNHKKKHGKALSATALCKKQVGQCIDFFTPACMGNPDCLATANRCCPSLGSCELDSFFDCVNQTGVETSFAPIATS